MAFWNLFSSKRDARKATEPETTLVGAKTKQFRHGDVMIQQIDKLPEQRDPLLHLILAHGELTGHAHRVVPSSAAKLFRSDGLLYLEVLTEGAQVVHEEHASIPLPIGYYLAWRQREYSPEEIRIVRD